MAKAKAASPDATTLHVDKADIVRALTAVGRVIENRNTYPILANVHLSTKDGQLTVRGTDLDIEITTSIPCDGDAEPFTAPAKTLLDIVRKFADGQVALEREGETLHVKSGRSRFKLPTLQVDSFPTLKGGKLSEPFAINLAALFKDTSFATNQSDNRTFMHGVQLESFQGKARATASDGHRLARITGEAVPDFEAVNFPLKTIGVIPDGDVTLAVSRDKVQIEFGSTTILSKLIDTPYPELERLIPKNNERAVQFDRPSMSAAVDRVSTIASERGGKSVKFTAGGGRVELAVTNPDHGEATDEVVTTYEGGDVSIGFNCSYVSDILRAAGGAGVTFHLADGLSPALVTCDDPNKTFVLMPQRI
ncbi:DNA polymerase III subunit beta [Devosia neptuniae]|uniref:Beta sliding clamp n=1 Tax=Devosia neptuniae TaxID=191302 RepID=A0ABY6CFB8_9HYPH|nr:DNA polymerase III subunit beta [Devosia neptuniae]UXN70936.1 DNA polymerase III subunit beta [Devosia neptuniae]